jgi:hypothetical protein
MIILFMFAVVDLDYDEEIDGEVQEILQRPTDNTSTKVHTNIIDSTVDSILCLLFLVFNYS